MAQNMSAVFILLAGLTTWPAYSTATPEKLPLQVPNEWERRDLDPRCTEAKFLGRILEDDAFRRALSMKARTGFLGRYRPDDYVAFSFMHYDEDIRAGLRAVNKNHSTYALIYSPNGCVWLLNSDGWPVASGIAQTRINQASLWSVLNVSVASRKRLLPMRKKRGEVCVVPPPVEFPERTAQEREESDHALAGLAQALLPKAIQDKLASNLQPARLVIIPTGNLRSVPFHALRINGRYLIDSYSILVSPSINTLRVAAQTWMGDYWGSNRTDVSTQDVKLARRLVVGNPDLSGHSECWTTLQHAEKEAKYVSQKLSVQALIGPEASHSGVLDRLSADASELDLIYFATHGFSDPVNPADGSFLALAEKHLRAAELRPLQGKFKRKPIVVMSACQSGLGKEFTGGIFGLAELWRYAGAAQIAMSLWDVSDSGTEQLMQLFIDRLIDQGMRDAEFAMAEAMRELKRRNPDPAIWAAFTIFGDVRP